MAQAAVSKHILSAFESSRSSAAIYISTLSLSSISYLVSNLTKSNDHIAAVKLLRALWLCVEIRPTILTSFCTGCSVNLSAFEDRLLEEIELLILEDARDTNTSPEKRMQSLTLCATAICKQMQTIVIDHQSSLLFHCAKAVSQVNHSHAKFVKQKILSYVFSFHERKKNLGYRSIMMILSNEIDLNPQYEQRVLESVEQEIFLNCDEQHLHRIFRAVILQSSKHTSKRTTRRLNQIAMRIIQKASDKTISEIISVTDHMVAEDYNICFELTQAFTETFNNNQTDPSPDIRIGASHVACLYGLLGSVIPRDCQKQIFSLLDQVLESDSIAFDMPRASSSTDTCTDLESRRRCVLLSSMRISGVVTKSQTVLDFFESKLWSPIASVRSLSRVLLHELYVWIPSCREPLLRTLTNTLENTSIPDQVAAEYCLMLEHVTATRQSLSSRACVDALVETLKGISLVKSPFDVRVVTAICIACAASPNAWDQVIIVLRKLAATRSRREQKLSAVGLLTLATSRASLTSKTKEACDMLISVLDAADQYVKNYVLGLVSSFLQEQPSRKECVWQLSRWVLNQLHILYPINPKNTQASQDLNHATPESESHERSGPFRDLFTGDSDFSSEGSLPAMLQLCSIMSFSKAHQSFLSEYTIYLGDVKGAFHSACIKHQSKSLREKITFLCQQFNVILSFPSNSINAAHVNIYGLLIIIRDFVNNQEPENFESKQTKKSIFSAKNEELLRQLTAREACAKDMLEGTVEDKIGSGSQQVSQLLRALSVLDNLQIEPSFKDCVSQELLAEMREAPISELSDKTRDMVLNVICDCFSRTTPLDMKKRIWRQHSHLSKNKSDKSASLQNGNVILGPSYNEDSVEISPESHLDKFLSSLDCSNEDIQPCLTLKYIKEAEKVARVHIREHCLSILLTIIREFRPSDWNYILWLTTFQAKSERELNTSRIHDTTDTGNFEVDRLDSPSVEVKVLVLQTIQELFQHEFSQSLSVRLAASFLDLLNLVLDKFASDKTDQEKVQNITATFATTLLRDYSIRHTVLIRKLLELLEKAFRSENGTKFVSFLLLWLGNDSCLVDSPMCIGNEENTQHRVSDFDEDIIEEAIMLDEYSKIDHVVATLNGNAAEEPEEIQTVFPATEEEKDYNDMNAEQKREIDPLNMSQKDIEQLCLNESTEIAFTATTWALRYLGMILETEVRSWRRTRDSRPITSSTELISATVDAMNGFFQSDFIKAVSFRKRILQDPLRQVVKIFISFLKTLNILLGTLSEMTEDDEKYNETAFKSVLVLSSKLATFCCDIEASKLLSVITSHGEGLNVIALLENISISTAQLSLNGDISTKKLSANIRKSLQGLVSQLEKLSHRLDNGKVGQGENEDGALGHTENIISRPKSRKDRVRSRNRYVDGWLQEERGEDNFADLEDFIVSMEEEDL